MVNGPTLATGRLQPSGSYLGEFGRHWRPLVAACMGLIAGTSAIYLNNLFSPYLIREFGWTRSQFALIGLTTLASVVFLPVAGRLADRFGMRRIALVGVISLPLVLIGLALQTGSFTMFFVLSTLQMLIQSALVGIIVYGRLLVREFDRARGLALGIASCAPALSTALVSPILGQFVEGHGWRAGYFLFAACVAALGGLALLTVPRSFRDQDQRPTRVRSARSDYGELIRSRPFLVIFGAMLLCNVHFTLQTTQLALILQEHGIAASQAATMVAVFATGVIAGRIACGLALDRFAPSFVAFVCFLLPAAGLAVLSTGVGGAHLIVLGVMSLGFSVGAEGDVASYLAARYFRPELFSSVLGLFTAAIATSALAGALILSQMLGGGSYSNFLGLASICAFAGAALFLLLGRDSDHVQPADVACLPG